MMSDLLVARESNEASAFAISLICCSPSLPTLFVCNSFETSDQWLNFVSFSGPKVKNEKDSSTLSVTACTSHSDAANLLKCSSTSEVIGCDLEGKLLDRAW
ncbi:hypothetical protein SCA6_006053 [Theobroma cacao]